MDGYITTQTYDAKAKGFRGKLENIVVVSDFDYTLNKYVPSDDLNLRSTTFGVLESVEKCRPFLPEFNELVKKYSPLGKGDYSLEEETEAMSAWTLKVGELLVKAGIDQEDISQAANSMYLQLREGTRELIDYSKQKNLPFFILSGGLGQVMEGFFERFKIDPAPYVIANYFDMAHGMITGYRGDIIHTYNKNAIISNHPEFSKIKAQPDLKYVLIGDMIGDAYMLDKIGIQEQDILKIAVLYEKTRKNINAYEKCFDVIIPEGSLRPILPLIGSFQ
jgi:HAD superfamily hydrolase (TIGR01544 family)